ncbi:MAG TPA: GDSL-type esterase/lipase family protein [Opitutaceae bacterium]
MKTHRSLPTISALWLAAAALLAPLVAPAAQAADAPPASRFIQNLRDGKKQTLVIFGTSLSKGGKWVAPLQAKLEQQFPGQLTVINGAESGRNSRWGLKMVEENVLAHQPDCVFIEFSINDAVARFKLSPEESRKNMEQILDRIAKKRPGCEVVLQIMNPVVGKPDGDKSQRVNQDAYDQIYRDLARKRGLLLVDNAPAWKNVLSTDGEAGFLQLVPDGVHPTAKAYEKVVVPEIFRTLGLAR